MFIVNNYTSFHLWWKKKFDQISKCLKILWRWFSAKFSFAWLTSQIVKNSHTLAKIYLMFLKNTLDLFLKLFALILGSNCLKSCRATKIVKQIKFKVVWGELKARNCVQIKWCTKYLRETSFRNFLRSFFRALKKFSFWL